ncbi:DUF4431 domain-containing protein [Dokdonella sp. MW10]|uniref:DUF4431 domain-containing protein n=1 Tax=Dokdonella sp. MW10 TaxID=2992926 RepID=UPI003F7E15A9
MHRILCSLCLMLGSVHAFASDACLAFDREGVVLTGLVYLKTFYGPPNYGESPDIDALETQALLALDAPLCVRASGEDSGSDAVGVTEVTLVPLAGIGFTKYAGRRVSVTGSLFPPITGHHRTAVLIEVRSRPDVLR